MGPKIIRIRKGNRGFTQIDNSIFYHPALKLECKGLMGLFLSFPDNWEVRVSHLVEILPEGKDAIYSTMKKLIQYGFLERQQERYANGRVGPVIYYVHERSILEQGSIPLPGKPIAVKPPLTKTHKNKDVNSCSDVKNESEDLFETTPAEVEEKEEAKEEVSEIQNEALVVEPEEERSAGLETVESSEEEPAEKAEPVEAEAAAPVECVNVYPCHDGVSKEASLLKHCLSVERKVEVAIGERLTETQQAVVEEVAHYFSVPGGERELADWVSQALTSPRSFSRCKTFVHKLNAMIKKIRTREFTRPRVFKASVASRAHQAITARFNASSSRLQILQKEIKVMQYKISSSRSAEVQFQAFPEIAGHHKSATTRYTEALHGLRAKLGSIQESAL